MKYRWLGGLVVMSVTTTLGCEPAAPDASEVTPVPAAQPGERAGFEELARLDVGENPHQIAFSPGGDTAFVAAAGSDRITLVHASSLTVLDAVPVTGTPLGVIPVPDGLIVSRFGSDAVSKVSRSSGQGLDRVQTGGAPSLFAPLPSDEYLVAVEQVDRVFRIGVSPFEMRDTYAVGDRPFPPAATSDGRLAFVPNYDDGTVTVLDLWNDRMVTAVSVGERPSGGVVLPDDIEYAVAVRGEDRVVFINTASRRVVGSLTEGIGASPFSVVLAPNGRLAFVNNTASRDISVIALPEKRVVARVPVPEIPIVIAVHPSGETLWVSSEGEHALTVIEIPEEWRLEEEAAPGMTEVAVLGMIHGNHRTSDRWGIDQLRETIRRIEPDVVCIEVPPDRWDRIWSDFVERGVFEDDRIRVFPEYVDVLFPLQREVGFEIEPCAGWTREMAQHRQARIAAFESDPEQAERRAEYERRRAEARAQYRAGGEALDDPRYLHSTLYDDRTKADFSIYDEYLNDWIGPGGWTDINEAHWRLIARSIERHRGERVLVTFGSSHKYWFLERLRERPDVRLIDVGPYLP